MKLSLPDQIDKVIVDSLHYGAKTHCGEIFVIDRWFSKLDNNMTFSSSRSWWNTRVYPSFKPFCSQAWWVGEKVAGISTNQAFIPGDFYPSFPDHVDDIASIAIYWDLCWLILNIFSQDNTLALLDPVPHGAGQLPIRVNKYL